MPGTVFGPHPKIAKMDIAPFAFKLFICTCASCVREPASRPWFVNPATSLVQQKVKKLMPSDKQGLTVPYFPKQKNHYIQSYLCKTIALTFLSHSFLNFYLLQLHTIRSQSIAGLVLQGNVFILQIIGKFLINTIMILCLLIYPGSLPVIHGRSHYYYKTNFMPESAQN